MEPKQGERGFAPQLHLGGASLECSVDLVRHLGRFLLRMEVHHQALLVVVVNHLRAQAQGSEWNMSAVS